MRIDNPSISGSLSFIGGNNSISATSVNLTGSFSGSVVGTFEGAFSSTATANISGAFDSVSSSLASRIASQENFSSSLDATFATDADLNLVSSSVDSLNAATSSYLLNTTDTLTGDLTVTGTLTAQEFHTEYVSGSIIYESGSTKFGDSLDDTHEFTGSIFLTGSLKYNTPTLRIVGTSTDGSDDQAFFFAAGGDTSDTRGAYIWGRGNEATNGGRIQINAGNTATGDILLFTGGSARMYISSSGTIGVGTSNPLTNLLSIRGYGAIDSNANQGILISSNHYYVTEDKYIGNGYGSIISQDTGGTYAGYIRFQQAGLNSSGAGAAMTLSDSMVIDSSGNLQIATTNLSGSGDPRLTVYSKGNYYNGSGTGLGDFHIGDGTYGLSIGAALGGAGAGDIRIWTTGGSHTLLIGTNSGDHLTLNSSGNLGVGTTSPVAKLHVRHSSTYPGLIVEADGGNEQIVVKRYSNTNEQLILGFHSSDYARIQAVEQGVGYRPLALNQDGGDVGIGMIAPAEKLEVSGSVKIGNIKIQNQDGGRIGFNRNTATGALYNSNYAAFQINGAYTGANYMEIQNYNSSGVFKGSIVLKDGNTGLGTTDPGAKLDIIGLTRVYGPSATTRADTHGISFFESNPDYRISFDSENGQRGFIRYNVDTAASVYHGHIFSAGDFSGTPSNLMFIRADGYVGIGTTAPATKLQVANAGEVIVRSSMTAADGYRGGFEADNQHTGGTIWSMFSTNNSDGYFGGGKYVIANESMGGVDANTTAKFVIDGSGNVGIGTISPAEKLQVAGNIRMFTAGYPLIDMGITTSNYFRLIYDNPNDNFKIGKNGAGDFTLTGAGKVGISSTSPSARLELGAGGFILKGSRGLYSSSYTGDGLFSANATPNFIAVSGYPSTYSKFSGQSGLILGYADNGAGLYSPAYGFEVKSTDGIPVAGRVVDALVMHDVDTDAIPWTVKNNGNTFILNSDPELVLTRSNHSASPAARLSFATSQGTVRWQLATNQAVGLGLEINQGNAANNRVYIDTTGNVGINSTSPNAKLNVVDSDGAAIVYQGDKRGKMIGKTIQRGTVSNPKTDLFTINSFQSSNSNLYAVVTVLYVSPTTTTGGKMSAQFWIDNDNQSSPTVGSFSHEHQVGGGTFSLEWDNTNKILKFVPDSTNYWYYVVDVEYVAFDGATVTFNTGHSDSET